MRNALVANTIDEGKAILNAFGLEGWDVYPLGATLCGRRFDQVVVAPILPQNANGRTENWIKEVVSLRLATGARMVRL